MHYSHALLLLLSAVAARGAGDDADQVLLFDDSAGEGRVFDGIGGLSGGGATSKLLVNYPQKQRDEILDYLFKPNFGASLQILKVEIGGDAQSTDGTEASHMHNAWDENYSRGYEWWLMLEAKKRNPNIMLVGLPWAFPGWIGDGKHNNPYTFPQRTADYVVNWVKGANDTYGLTIDMIGIWNERVHNVTYIKTLRRTLDNRGFPNVKLITADCATRYTSVYDDVYEDQELQKALYAMGFHYPGTVTPPRAKVVTQQANIQLWSSEDYSSRNGEHGGACWARLLNRNYVNGLMTATISWNLIAAYYKDLPYAHCGLMDALEPWSGNYNVSSPIWMTAHTTQFTEPGWIYLPHGAGVGRLSKGGSYVSLRDPHGYSATIIIETMAKNDAHCIRGFEPVWFSEEQTVTLKLAGRMTGYTTFYVWYSKLTFDGKSTLFEKKDSITFVNNTATLELGVNEVWTLTTIKNGKKGSYGNPPASADFPLPYSDDFESYNVSKEANNLAQQTGSFEVMQDAGATKMSSGNKYIRQVVLDTPIWWCGSEKAEKALNIIGDGQWKDMMVEASVRLPTVNASKGAWVAAHVSGVGCGVERSPGVFLVAQPGKYLLTSNLNYNSSEVIKTGALAMKAGEWHTLSLMVKGNTAQGAFDGQALFNTTLPKGVRWKGFAGLGTDSWGLADFDNLKLANATEGAARMRGYFRRTYRHGNPDHSLYFETES